ncbi:MAG: phosphatase PAP2 family protein [Suipraeoptans sp.]
MNLKEHALTFLRKYKHGWVFLYFFIYMPWFVYLENRSNEIRHFIIESPLDKYIPFCEFFIIPYLLWFALMICVGLYFFLTDKKGFYKLIIFLYSGMTLFLIISTFFPNGQALRPYTFARDNIFVDIVKQLYRTDTPTNVLPSIHVFNTLGILSAVKYSPALKKHKLATGFIYVLSALIILATMFLKQHSVTDVVAAFALAAVMHVLVYVVQYQKAPTLTKQPIR